MIYITWDSALINRYAALELDTYVTKTEETEIDFKKEKRQ